LRSFVEGTRAVKKSAKIEISVFEIGLQPSSHFEAANGPFGITFGGELYALAEITCRWIRLTNLEEDRQQ
jgi:hypothetical protein